jgi:DNA-directed RNA polymerase subunit M/transcription elongation factor TFIIS
MIASKINKKDKLQIIKNLSLNNFNSNIFKPNINDFNFITGNSEDISNKLLIYAINNINRYQTIYSLADILKSINHAKEIEKGIFEFALIHTMLHGLEDNNVVPVYLDKFNEIHQNLDENNRLNNKTLKNNILNNHIKPYYVAFLSPQQMHPEKWKDLLDKIKYREEKENNIAFTDLYQCKKCKQRKSKITELQIRSADEPTSKFITCLVCYNTFIL